MWEGKVEPINGGEKVPNRLSEQREPEVGL